MQRLREEAARRGCTMSELVEAGLRRILDEPKAAKKPLPPLLTKDMGEPLVDIADKDALYDLLDEDKWKALYGVEMKRDRNQ